MCGCVGDSLRSVKLARFLARTRGDPGGGEDVRGDKLVKQALELAVGEADAVEGFELVAEVLFQRGAVADVVTVGVFETAQLLDKRVLDALLFKNESLGNRALGIAALRRHG